MKVIGIDIDDTITKSSDGIKEYIINHPNEFEDSKQLLNDVHHILSGHKITNDTTRFLNEIFSNLLEEVALRENVTDILGKLKHDGYKIILITAREDTYFPKGAELITINYLKRNNVPYDLLITNSLNKVKVCLDYHVDLMIDDSVHGCTSLKEAGINTLLFTTNLNKDIETSVRRVNNWLEMYEFIRNM
jgi:uncharacterized HAD superfamily protein